jgi:sugar transferase (PEP-CTERM/EpsH1 system associated)
VLSTSCHIVHVIYRLDFGGMENGLVNLVNRLPEDRYRHTIITLTIATEFRRRIEREDVEIIECDKPPGNHLPTYRRVFGELRRLKPDIVHTRNLGALDMSWVAKLAGRAQRIHGEHGWSPDDPLGQSRKYRRLRRLCDPAIWHYVAVSSDIKRWLTTVIGIAESKVGVLHNGVDWSRFDANRRGADGSDVAAQVVFGTLGRHEPIKGLGVLLEAVRDLLERRPDLRARTRLVMAGDGPERERHMKLRAELGLDDIVEIPGAVDDVPALLKRFTFFVQPSLNEGISNTILEAMASGLPVIATDTGGNPELVRDDYEGKLVPPNDPDALASAIEAYIDDPGQREQHGTGARERAKTSFSIDAMVQGYDRLYRRACVRQGEAAA